jgi:hypothetical protein
MTDKVDENRSADSLASGHVKLPRSNLGNAKRTYKEIKADDKNLGRDLKRQDFGDASFQSMKMEDAAKRESGETQRLRSSQNVRAQEIYAKQKRKISNREYRETKRQIRHERHTSKAAVKSEKKSIRHLKGERKRQNKLQRLQEKAQSPKSLGDSRSPEKHNRSLTIKRKR